MATKLTKSVIREVVLTDAYGKTAPVIVTLTGKGIFLKAKRKHRELFVSWDRMKPSPPENMPAKYTCNLFGWLVE